MKLPSKYQIGDNVNLNFYVAGIINNCIVDAVHFEYDKVYYDIAIPIDISQHTVLKYVDSAFVIDNV